MPKLAKILDLRNPPLDLAEILSEGGGFLSYIPPDVFEGARNVGEPSGGDAVPLDRNFADKLTKLGTVSTCIEDYPVFFEPMIL